MEQTFPFDKPIKDDFFTDEDILKHNYIPLALPGRDEQIQEIQYFLYPVLRGKNPPNLLIYGKPGSGKTVVIKHVMKQLDEKIIKEKLPTKAHSVYVRCPKTVTETQVLRLLLTQLVQQHVPTQGWGIDRYYDVLETTLKKRKKICLVVLDEVDKLKGDSILYNLTRIEKNPPAIIGISNDLKFVETLDPRVVSSFGEERYVFPPYNAEELKEILCQRAESGLKKNVLDDSVIPLCAALAAQEHGDARRAIDLLRESVKIAQNEAGKKVSEQHLRKAQTKIERDIVKQLVTRLPIQSKTTLAAALFNEKTILLNKKDKKEMETGDIYETYQKMCNHIIIPPVTQRRFTDYINELDMLGIINARTIYKGRYGKTKHISLAVPFENLETAIFEDETMGVLRDYKPPTHHRRGEGVF